MTDFSQHDTQALLQRRSDLEYALQGMMLERVPFVDEAEREMAAIDEELARRDG
mgnify:CR=1 FL=1